MSVDDPARTRAHPRPPVRDSAVDAPASSSASSSGPPRLQVRLHAPHPHTAAVLVSVAGPVNESSAPLFAETVAAPFGAAVHVVIDLSEVTTLTQAGLKALLDLDRAATRSGTQLHLTGTSHPQTSHHVAGHLLRLCADHLIRLDDPLDHAAPEATGP